MFPARIFLCLVMLLGLVMCVLAQTGDDTAFDASDADGPTLLIVSRRTGKPEIYLVDPASGKAKNLTNEASENSYPAWSPDGKRIAFVSNRSGTFNVYTMDADGNSVKQLTNAKDISRAPCWSPDGKKIAFNRLSNNSGLIYIMNADGGGEKRVSPMDGWDPAWSPDGTSLAYVSSRGGKGFRLYTMNADGSNDKELTTNNNRHGWSYPAWSPDGKKIVYTDQADDGLEIFVIDVDGKNRKQLTKLGSMNTYAAWSPDGKKIIFRHHDGDNPGPLYVMDADGSNQKALSQLKEDAPIQGGRPAWRPKSRQPLAQAAFKSTAKEGGMSDADIDSVLAARGSVSYESITDFAKGQIKEGRKGKDLKDDLLTYIKLLNEKK